MAFKTDGSVHYKGVKGEHEIVLFLNKEIKDKKIIKLFKNEYGLKLINKNSMNFIHVGGTKNNQDVLESKNKIKISVKTKETKNNKPTGTFDLINSSSLKELVKVENKKFYSIFNEMNEFKKEIRNEYLQNSNLFNDEKIEGVRRVVKLQCNKILRSINGEVIEALLKKFISKKSHITITRLKYENSSDVQIGDVYFLGKNWINDVLKNIDFNQIFSNDKNSSAPIKNIDNTNSPFFLSP